MSFGTVGNFTINFYARDLFSDHNIGNFRFMPLQKSISKDKNRNISLLLKNNHHQYGLYPLLYLRHQYQSIKDGKILFTKSTEPYLEKIVLASSADESGALYEVTFTLKCEPIEEAKTGTPRSWNYIINKETKKNIEQKFSVVEKSQNSLLPLTNHNFGGTTINNSVELMIDGKETFKRYFEVSFIFLCV